MNLKISKVIIESLIEHAKRDAPIEACGYLGGIDSEVTQIVPMCNTDASEQHYSLDPREQFHAVKSLRAQGLKVLAVYHSHPCTPARMSLEDIRLAHDPDMSYVIVSLESDPVVKSFRIENGLAVEQDIEVVQG